MAISLMASAVAFVEAPARSADGGATIVGATAHYNRTLEAAILEHPTQWMWSHRRFRHSPDITENLYSQASGNRLASAARRPESRRRQSLVRHPGEAQASDSATNP